MIELPRHSLVSDAINEFIKFINQHLEDKAYDFSLSPALEFYAVRFARKKNGRPKFDYPAVGMDKNVY